jgi:hypothetical protein
MELYFPCLYDARAVRPAPTKNQIPVIDPAARGGDRASGAGGLGREWLIRCLASMALLIAAACSSGAETASETYQANGGGAAPGETAAPNGENQGPGATETNFLTLPCDEDADCGDVRCILPSEASVGPGPTRSPDAPDATSDAGTSDAGIPLGYCAQSVDDDSTP